MKMNRDIKMKSQAGFAAQGAIIIALAAIISVGTGYFILSRQNSDPEPIIVEQVSSVESGTLSADNAVQVVADQVNSELVDEIDQLDNEDAQTDIDDAAVADLEGAIDEANL